MTRTVNGKDFKDVLRELRLKKEPPHSLDNGVKYFSADEYFEIFDSVVGPANYNVEYSDFQYTKTDLGKQQELFSVKCRITILDDDGNPFLTKEGYGGYVCRYNKDTNKDVNLQNAPDFVCSYAFKTAAKKFGTFGFTQAKEKPSNNKQTSKSDNNKKGAGSSNKKEVLNFCTDGAFFVAQEKDNGPVYKVNAYEIVGDKMRDSADQIIFYPNNYRKCSDKMNYYINSCNEDVRKRLRINVSCIREEDGKKQYVFFGFDAA